MEIVAQSIDVEEVQGPGTSGLCQSSNNILKSSSPQLHRRGIFYRPGQPSGDASGWQKILPLV